MRPLARRLALTAEQRTLSEACRFSDGIVDGISGAQMGPAAALTRITESASMVASPAVKRPMTASATCDQATITKIESDLESMKQAVREVVRSHFDTAKTALAAGDMATCTTEIGKAMEGYSKTG